MGMTINNCWKLCRYGVKRYHYCKFIGIGNFLEQLAIDCFNNNFSTYTGTPSKNTPIPDKVNDGETVYTFREINSPSSDYCSTEVRTIYDITINSASSPAYTFVDSTIEYQHNSVK